MLSLLKSIFRELHHLNEGGCWIQWCRISHWLNDCEAAFDGSPPYSLLPSKWHTAECFCLSGGLYRLSNLINKASEICLLFIFPVLQGFARAGKLPFSGRIFPRHCGAFLLFLMESDEHSQGTPCYPLASIQWKSKKAKKCDSRLWQLPIWESTSRGRGGAEYGHFYFAVKLHL